MDDSPESGSYCIAKTPGKEGKKDEKKEKKEKEMERRKPLEKK